MLRRHSRAAAREAQEERSQPPARLRHHPGLRRRRFVDGLCPSAHLHIEGGRSAHGPLRLGGLGRGQRDFRHDELPDPQGLRRPSKPGLALVLAPVHSRDSRTGLDRRSVHAGAGPSAGGLPQLPRDLSRLQHGHSRWSCIPRAIPCSWRPRWDDGWLPRSGGHAPCGSHLEFQALEAPLAEARRDSGLFAAAAAAVALGTRSRRLARSRQPRRRLAHGLASGPHLRQELAGETAQASRQGDGADLGFVRARACRRLGGHSVASPRHRVRRGTVVLEQGGLDPRPRCALGCAAGVREAHA
mmetsp:Transcript_165462/g.525936  ORF Transcript_165462/g.525936 Transcript_165462/m.525936 type:complete len:300 (-) Transcript_165462:194-1093(-)